METKYINQISTGETFEKIILFDKKNVFMPSGVPIEKIDLDLLKKWNIKELYLLDEENIQTLKSHTDLYEAYKDEGYLYTKVFDALIDDIQKFFLGIKNKNFQNFKEIKNQGVDIIKLANQNNALLTFAIMIYKKENLITPVELMALQTAVISTVIGRLLNLDTDKLQVLFECAILIDTGMLAISSKITSKDEALTPEEFITIKKHPIISYKIAMESLKLSKLHGITILSHHESLDGSGYPQKLTRDNIPLLSRIIAVCQAFIAITQKRTYRENKDYYSAMKELISDTTIKYDPIIIKYFIAQFSLYPIGNIVRLSNDIIGIVMETNPTLPLKPIVKPIFDGQGNAISMPSIDLAKKSDISIREVVRDETIISRAQKEL